MAAGLLPRKLILADSVQRNRWCLLQPIRSMRWKAFNWTCWTICSNPSRSNGFIRQPIGQKNTIQQKAQGVVRQHAIADIVETPDHFFVKVDNKYERIDVQNILYVEGMQNYVKIHTKGQEYMTLLTLKSVKEKLSSDQFMRIHKSYLVAKDKVMAMEGNQLVVGKDKLTISRNYRDEVKRRLLQENLLNGKK